MGNSVALPYVPFASPFLLDAAIVKASMSCADDIGGNVGYCLDYVVAVFLLLVLCMHLAMYCELCI